MSYSRSMEEAVAAIKKIDAGNEANMAGSPVLNGQDSGGPAAKGEIAPKTFVLGPHSTELKRTL